MMLDFACEGCGQKYRVDIGLSGRQIRCKKCGEAVTVPSPNAVAPTPRTATSVGAVAEPKGRSRPTLQSFGQTPAAKPPAPRMEEVRKPPGKPHPPRDEEDFDDGSGLEVVGDTVDDLYAMEQDYAPPVARRTDPDDELPGPGRSKPKKSKVKRRRNPAGFGQRLAALIVDGFVMTPVVIFLVMGVAPAPLGEGPLSSMIDARNFYVMILVAIYYAIMEGLPTHATLGKMAAGLKVVDTEGLPVTPMRAAARAALRGVFGFFGLPSLISAITVMASERKQALHDMIAGTMIVTKD